MARPVQYDKDAVIHQAMMQFWKEGYHRSSVDKLVVATELNKHSLYNGFGGKQGLFTACLSHYIEQQSRPFLAILETERGLPAIRQYFGDIQKSMAFDQGSGCLMINTVIELGDTDPQVADIISRYYQYLSNLLNKKLIQGQEDGDVPASIPTAGVAQWLVHTSQGLVLNKRLAKTASPQADINALLSLISSS